MRTQFSIVSCVLAGVCFGLFAAEQRLAAEEVLPKHITPETLKAVRDGLDYLARTQADDGGWHEGSGGQAYPVSMTALACTALLAHGDTPSRGRYAPQLEKGTEYLIKSCTKTGLITSPSQESGRPMHGHGFALMYLASVYGMLSKESLREECKAAIEAGVQLTSSGQSSAGGWTYIPASGDEGSVTVTQVQALRAAHNAGFFVPRATLDESVRYLERCSTPDGGIMYSLGSGGGARPAITAAAVATLYNAGEYDSPIAKRCLTFIWQQARGSDGWGSSALGHSFYYHHYAAQAYYLSGDEYWDEYFPPVRDRLIATQSKADGSWEGDGIGKIYGTSVALVILQLPYRFLPVYQR